MTGVGALIIGMSVAQCVFWALTGHHVRAAVWAGWTAFLLIDRANDVAKLNKK